MAIDTALDVDLAELQAISEELEIMPASTSIKWAVDRFPGQVALACSFQDCVIVDIATQHDPQIEVIFLDTGFHFQETLDYVETVRSRYNLNLTVTHPGPEAEGISCGDGGCCDVRKVAPMNRALRGKSAWLTGLKRVDAVTRAKAPILGWDVARQMVKVNPLANWTDEDVFHYIADHKLPKHPLMDRGYLSIGCAPTTRPVAPGEDPRAGRWADSSKTECGLHV